MDSSRIPVLVGIAQIEQRTQDVTESVEPLDMMLDAVRRAGEDSGRTEVLSQTQAVYVTKGVWSYKDPGRVIAQEIGADGAASVGTAYGGNMVQSCINDACSSIQRGDLSVAILTGAEVGRSLAMARRTGVRLEMREAGQLPDRLLGQFENMMHELEQKHGINLPVYWYAMFESAIRHGRGESLDENRDRVSKLWSGFNDVAVDNPHAWIRESVTADEIRTPSENNRMIGFPYPMLMNANSRVDQGAALIICSLARAEELGIPSEKWVFPHSGSEGHDSRFLSNRDSFSESLAVRVAGARALELAQLSVEDLDYVDLYSCFPSAVQVAAKELGLSQERPLTVTGGLTFGGGPLNNYVMHSVTRMAEVLRANPGKRGLVTANGGALTKHAMGIYSTDIPTAGFRYADIQAELDGAPQRKIVDDHDGPVTIEAYTVVYDQEGPDSALVACRLEDGSRAWATRKDRSLALAFTQEEFCGQNAYRRGDGQLNLN